MRARATGQGMDIDTPLYDVAMNNLSYPATWHLNEGFEPKRVARSGHPSLVPSELYRTADGWIFVMANKANFWPALCQAMERPEWIDDPQMRNFAARYENRDEVVRRLEEVFLTRTTEAWLERLSGVLPCAPVNDVAGALASDFAERRRMVQEVAHPERGAMRLGAPADYRGRRRHAAPRGAGARCRHSPPFSPSSATNRTRSTPWRPTARSTAPARLSASRYDGSSGTRPSSCLMRRGMSCSTVSHTMSISMSS